MSSAASSSSQISHAFPARGDTLDSVDDVKRAFYQACLSAGIEGVVELSNDTSTQIRCRLRSDSTAITTGKGEACTFGIHASCTGVAGRRLKINRIETAHSCDPKVRQQRRECARVYVESKLAELGSSSKGKRARAPAPPSPADDSAADGGEERSSDDEKSSDEEQPRSLRAKRRDKPYVFAPSVRPRKEPAAAPSIKEAGESPGEAQSNSSAIVFPKAKQLRPKIQALLETKERVRLPDLLEPFDSTFDLLTHLFAYARVEGITLRRITPATGTTAFVLQCDGPLKGEQAPDGTWSLVERTTEHQHASAHASAGRRGRRAASGREPAESSNDDGDEIRVARPQRASGDAQHAVAAQPERKRARLTSSASQASLVPPAPAALPTAAGRILPSVASNSLGLSLFGAGAAALPSPSFANPFPLPSAPLCSSSTRGPAFSRLAASNSPASFASRGAALPAAAALAAAHAAPAAAPAAPPTAHAPASHPFHPTLLALLLAAHPLVPRPTLSRIAQTLLRVGVASPDDLVSLLRMEEATVRDWFDRMGAMGVCLEEGEEEEMRAAVRGLRAQARMEGV
ncbi:hypothetical protein JCM10450v2_002086 [Rhodotorula kratochvilovae]